MQKSDRGYSHTEFKNVLVISVVAFSILTGATVASYRYAKRRTPTIVLPGGVTYLGPSGTNGSTPLGVGGKIFIAPDEQWVEYKGKLFPYSFSHPKSLSLGFFPNDPFDAVTIFWGNTNPQENLLLRVEDLTKIPNTREYIGKSKKSYAENWWRQYNYKGVTAVSQFTNNRGLSGWRASFLEADGQTKRDHVFFDVTGRPELVIWMASRLLEETVFDKIVDSVSWK